VFLLFNNRATKINKNPYRQWYLMPDWKKFRGISGFYISRRERSNKKLYICHRIL